MLQKILKLAACILAALTCLVLSPAGDASAQGMLSFSGQVRSAYPQSTIAEPAATVPKTCSSISSKSRRCHFTFAADCKKRGDSKEHCTAMSGFCHACTDAYSQCKGEQVRLAEKSRTGVDCARCNTAYSQCIVRMVQQYGGKLVR